jgi:hypothetical protein
MPGTTSSLQAQVDDLETLLAHHDEHGWEESDEERSGTYSPGPMTGSSARLYRPR